jgi:phospholipid-binding lipoprotein MlaA
MMTGVGNRPVPFTVLITILALGVLSAGCASHGGAERTANPDPLEPINRVSYKINDVGDRYLLRPVAKVYDRITPQFLKIGINNFFDNIEYPRVIINDFLQGKFAQGTVDTGRFLVNSTVGVGGLFDPAKDLGLRVHDEDFGQTFAVWGIPAGPYLVVPLFGPRTLRHAFGTLAETQVSPVLQLTRSTVRTSLTILFFVHQRYTLLGPDEQVYNAFDPYAFVRDAYLQNREYLIYDGNLPEEDLFLDDEFEDEDF